MSLTCGISGNKEIIYESNNLEGAYQVADVFNGF
jgi:hypothetical protein